MDSGENNKGYPIQTNKDAVDETDVSSKATISGQ